MNENQLMSPEVKALTDYIYEKPENVVLVLNKYGYNIDVKTTTLFQITEATLDMLYNGNNPQFAKDLDDLIASKNEEYSNFLPIILAAVSLGTSLYTSFAGAKLAREEGDKNRQLQTNLALMDLAFRDKLEYEKLKVKAETERNQILLNSLQSYRQYLQQVSTQRIKDTWVYGVGLLVSVGIVVAIVKLILPKE
jgi:hypothetical protein